MTGNIISAIGEQARDSKDMSGLTVIPGLIDAHVHMTADPSISSIEAQLSQTDEEIQTKMGERAVRMVHAGITTARDLGGGRWLELELRDQIAQGTAIGPMLLCAGQPLTIPEGHCHFWGGSATGLSEIKEVITRQHEHNVDLIKIMATGGVYTPKSHPGRAQFSQDHMSFAVRQANELGYSVAAHCHGTEGISRAVKAGVSTVEHCSWLETSGKRGICDPKVVAEIVSRGSWVSPTINGSWARFFEGVHDPATHPKQLFLEMKKAGVKFVASTDAGIPNVYHHELVKGLELFAGLAELSPAETLKSATSDSALALGIESLTGSISVGKKADLLFVKGDPLSDLNVLQHPEFVVAAGNELRN